MEHTLNVLITIGVFIFAIVQILAFGKGFLKRQSKEPANRMPSFGGEGPGGWVEREMKRRLAAGNKPGAGPSHSGDASAPRAEAIPADGGHRSSVRSGAERAEAHFEGYEKDMEWEARKRMYDRQDRAQLGNEQRESDEARKQAENLRRAIVWAEIIGPPRAKRPYGK